MFNNPFISAVALNRIPKTLLEDNRDCSARCAAMIRTYWKERKRSVEVWLEPISVKTKQTDYKNQTVYIVKSSLLNGLPRE